MDAIASQITSLTIVYSIVYSDADQRKHQSSASLAFVRRIHRGPVNSPHKWPVTRKMFPFDDVIMTTAIPPWHVLTSKLNMTTVTTWKTPAHDVPLKKQKYATLCPTLVVGWWCRHCREHFPLSLSFMRGIHRAKVDWFHSEKARNAELGIFFVCVIETSCWTNSRVVGNLRSYGPCDIIAMSSQYCVCNCIWVGPRRCACLVT